MYVNIWEAPGDAEAREYWRKKEVCKVYHEKQQRFQYKAENRLTVGGLKLMAMLSCGERNATKKNCRYAEARYQFGRRGL